MRHVAGRSPPTIEQSRREARPHRPPDVVLQVVAHAEDPLRRQAQMIAGGLGKRRMRFAITDFRRDHQARPSRPARAVPARPRAAGHRSSSRRRPRPRSSQRPAAPAPRRGSTATSRGAEMIPELVESPVRVGHLGQDPADDPPPAPPLGRLVGRETPGPRPPRRCRNGPWNRSRTSSGSSSTPCRRAASAYAPATEGSGLIKVPTASRTIPSMPAHSDRSLIASRTPFLDDRRRPSRSHP